MNYKLNVDDISVIETTTQFLVKKFENINDARKFMRSLNLGGGFDGFTPSFFMKSVADKLPENRKNINRKRKNK